MNADAIVIMYGEPNWHGVDLHGGLLCLTDDFWRILIGG